MKLIFSIFNDCYKCTGDGWEENLEKPNDVLQKYQKIDIFKGAKQLLTVTLELPYDRMFLMCCT